MGLLAHLPFIVTTIKKIVELLMKKTIFFQLLWTVLLWTVLLWTIVVDSFPVISRTYELRNKFRPQMTIPGESSFPKMSRTYELRNKFRPQMTILGESSFPKMSRT